MRHTPAIVGLALTSLLGACSDGPTPWDSGALDGAADGRVPDAQAPDGQTPDTGVGDGAVSALPFCVEAEDLGFDGEVRRWPGQPSTMGAIAMLAPADGGRVYFDFTLGAEEAVELWARVRAPTHSNNSLSVGIEDLAAAPDDATAWHIPITPVLSWQRVLPRGVDGREWRPEDDAWPGVLTAGSHRLVVAGREPAVELDAFCVTSTGAPPAPRFVSPPERTDVIRAADHGAVGGLGIESRARDPSFLVLLGGRRGVADPASDLEWRATRRCTAERPPQFRRSYGVYRSAHAQGLSRPKRYSVGSSRSGTGPQCPSPEWPLRDARRSESVGLSSQE